MNINILYFYWLLWMFLLSIVTFFMFHYDKRCAVLGKRRTPEWVLLTLSAVGGSIGALSGMLLFHHKTQKPKFNIIVPIFFAIQVALAIYLKLTFDQDPDFLLPVQ